MSHWMPLATEAAEEAKAFSTFFLQPRLTMINSPKSTAVRLSSTNGFRRCELGTPARQTALATAYMANTGDHSTLLRKCRQWRVGRV